MTIVDKIRDSLQQFTGTPCYYQSEEQLNTILDYGQLPCTFFDLLRTQQVTTDIGNLRERVQVAIFFADVATGFDFNATDNERVIDAQKTIAFKWVLSMATNNNLRLLSVDGSERAYAEYDVLLTGFAIRVTLEELYGVTMCNGASD